MTSLNLKKFKLVPNSKSPTTEWIKCNQSKSIKLYESSYKGNLGVACGKINNIIVVDTDFYKGNSESFIKEFGNKYYDDFNTFTNKTGKGGYHLYFKYDKDIYNFVSAQHNIDIFTDGKYVVSDGSIVNDFFTYTTYNNVEIKVLPIKLKKWIIKNLTDEKEQEWRNKNKPLQKIKPKIKNPLKKNKKETIEITYDKDVKYNIPKDEIIKIVRKFDIRYWSNRIDFLRWTSFCKVLNCKDIWDMINKEHPKNYNKEKNESEYWNKADSLIHIVDAILKENKQDAVISYYKLKKIIINDVDYETTINKDKLGYDFIDNKNNYVIRSDTGTGKTTSFKHYIKNTNQRFISIVSRISLGEEQYNIFNEYGIDTKFYQFLGKKKAFDYDDNCITTIDSIIKTRNLDLSDYVLFLDEFASIVEYLITSDTLNKNRSIIYKKFIYLIQNCKQVICTDADINQYCIDFLNMSNIKFTTVNNTYLHNKSVCASEIYEHVDFIKKLKSEKSFLCCTDSKENAELIYKEIGGKNDDDCILIVSGVDEYCNLDSHLKVIFSPKIIYGLDSVMKRPVYTYYKEHTINPSNMVQQVSRCRNITKLQYLFSKKKYTHNNVTLEELDEFFNYCNTDSIGYFKEMTDVNTTTNYINLLSKYTYQNMCYGTNKFAYFLSILEKRGFNITYIYEKTIAQIATELKELKNDKLNEFDSDFLSASAQKINEYLHLPDDKIEQYKELFINRQQLDDHFTMCKYLNNNNVDHLEDLIQNKDFNCNKFLSTKMKLIFINNIKKECKCIDGVNLPENITKKNQIKYMNEYNSIFRNRDKKLNMNSLCDTQKIFIKMLRSTLDNKYIISKRVGKTKKYDYSINKDNVKYHMNIYKFRKQDIGDNSEDTNDIMPTKRLF